MELFGAGVFEAFRGGKEILPLFRFYAWVGHNVRSEIYGSRPEEFFGSEGCWGCPKKLFGSGLWREWAAVREKDVRQWEDACSRRRAFMLLEFCW